MTARIFSRAALALAAVLSLAAGTSSGAYADSFRHRDATGDVRFIPSGSTVSGSYINPQKRDPDIEHYTVLHSRWKVTVATTIREVNPYANGWRAFIETSKGDHLIVSRSNDEFTGKPELGLVRNDGPFTCRGIYVSRTSSGIIAKVPTRCLGNPWKVRVGVLVLSEYGCCGGSGYDDPLRNGAITENEPRMSPWIAR